MHIKRLYLTIAGLKLLSIKMISENHPTILYPLRIKGIDEKKRDQIIQKIFDKDVSVNVHFIPLPMMSFYKNLGYKMNDYPVTYENFSREISLPVYYNLTDEDVQTVIESVIKSVEEVIG